MFNREFFSYGKFDLSPKFRGLDGDLDFFFDDALFSGTPIDIFVGETDFGDFKVWVLEGDFSSSTILTL